MSNPIANTTLRYLQSVSPISQDISDIELLERFTRHRDQQAFALLVYRYAPMVMGVCRRVLGSRTEADDAFQASFLALARQASSVNDCLGGWLHRVTLRAAQRACRKSYEESLKVEPVDRDDPFAMIEWRELRSVLDIELARLPAKLQTPLVLCYLEGLTRDEAADRLNWSLRTLHRRLDEGRKILHRRLVKRGIAPILLASVAIQTDFLLANVPRQLLQNTAELSQAGMTIPATVERLVPVLTLKGTVMKVCITAFIVAMGVLGFNFFTKAEVDQFQPQEDLSKLIARAPNQKPPADPLAEKVAMPKKKAIEFLRKQQGRNGGWDEAQLALGSQEGGLSALVVLALLEAGVPADDEAIKNGLSFLRSKKPAGTYTVSLLIQAFCKAKQKDDEERIKELVAWLESAIARDQGKFLGWSYTKEPTGRADNSNNRYAIAALYAAEKSGYKVANKNLWKEISEYYLDSQKDDGGWGYIGKVATATSTMTSSGILCTNMSHKVHGDLQDASKAATEKGEAWLVKNFKIQQSFVYYHLDVIGAMGRILQSRKIADRDKTIDWYRDGVEWLLTQQKQDGSFAGKTGGETSPRLCTAFALRFLSTPAN